MENQEEIIAQNLHSVRQRMRRAAETAGRDPAAVCLVVVTKTQPLEMIRAAIAAGATCLGENYADEAVAKITALPEAEWHMIGHVQSRKANLVAGFFQMLHSLDSMRLAARLDRFAAVSGRKLPVLLECNTSGEETKFGYPAWDEHRWAELLPEFRGIAALPNLELRGLMTMAPYGLDPELARPFFRRLARLQDYLRAQLDAVPWSELSMGMSADFETAIEEGATMVRIGQSIFGPRNYG